MLKYAYSASCNYICLKTVIDVFLSMRQCTRIKTKVLFIPEQSSSHKPVLKANARDYLKR